MTTGEYGPNWVAGWLLYSVFRSRDVRNNRNRRRGNGVAGGGGGGGVKGGEDGMYILLFLFLFFTFYSFESWGVFGLRVCMYVHWLTMLYVCMYRSGKFSSDGSET